MSYGKRLLVKEPHETTSTTTLHWTKNFFCALKPIDPQFCLTIFCGLNRSQKCGLEPPPFRKVGAFRQGFWGGFWKCRKIAESRIRKNTERRIRKNTETQIRKNTETRIRIITETQIRTIDNQIIKYLKTYLSDNWYPTCQIHDTRLVRYMIPD